MNQIHEEAHKETDAEVGLFTNNTKEETHEISIRGSCGGIQKKTAEILGSLRKGMTAVCMDESVFVYNSVVRRV